jgi:hypothetical protein
VILRDVILRGAKFNKATRWPAGFDERDARRAGARLVP